MNLQRPVVRYVIESLTGPNAADPRLQLVLGATDSSVYAGPLTTVGVTLEDYWQVPTTGFFVNGNAVAGTSLQAVRVFPESLTLKLSSDTYLLGHRYRYQSHGLPRRGCHRDRHGPERSIA